MSAIAGLFPGQGSQQVGMGKAFLETSDRARALTDAADRALGFSLSRLMLEGPLDELTLTQNAQPALLTVAYIAYQESGLKLAAAAGHSLGEYTALTAAGSLSFEEAVELVHKRGRYMQEAVPPEAGAMVAIMGSSEEEIREVLSNITEVVEVANLNAPGQTVVAGHVAGVEELGKQMAERGGKVIRLNVSAPFHCSLMKPAADQLAKDLDAIEFRDPAFPVYANVTANKIESGEHARQLLKDQVCAAVRWTELVQNLVKQHAIDIAVEFGPGGVLSKLLKRIDRSLDRAEVAGPGDVEALRDKIAT